jgi:hypothetical protein
MVTFETKVFLHREDRSVWLELVLQAFHLRKEEFLEIGFHFKIFELTESFMLSTPFIPEIFLLHFVFIQNGLFTEDQIGHSFQYFMKLSSFIPMITLFLKSFSAVSF